MLKKNVILISLFLIVVSVFSQIIAAPTTSGRNSLINLGSNNTTNYRISNWQTFGLGVLGTAGAAFAISEFKGDSKTTTSTPVSNVYVVDRGNNMMQKFNTEGDYLLTWTSPNLVAPEYDAVDSGENVYVTDSTNDIIVKFDKNGNEITTENWPVAIGEPEGVVAINCCDEVYVSDRQGVNDRVRKFDSYGNEIIGGNWPIIIAGEPAGVAIDNAGNVYLADNAGVDSKIIKFDNDGNQLASAIFLNSDFRGIAVDYTGNIYTADRDVTAIRKFDSSLNEIIGGNWPIIVGGNVYGVTVDIFNNVYATDTVKDRVLKFNSEGDFIKAWSSAGTRVLDTPQGIAIKRYP